MSFSGGHGHLAMYEQLIWRPLPLDPSHGLPVLLAAVSIGENSYSVRVTDMANLWMETLDRKAICMRGFMENTTIDPSDTPANMAMVLSSLRSALDPSQPGHDQTSLTLSPGWPRHVGRGGLRIEVICQIPGIRPLRWPMQLKKAPPSSLATDLVLPLMEGQFDRKLEVQSLTQLLKHKDMVIAKLADKLEAMGAGLDHVFPGLAGKRKLTRSLAEEKIHGLAPFNKSKWMADLYRPEERPSDVASLLQSVLEGDGLRNQSIMEIDASPDLDGWFHDFGPCASRPRPATQTAGVPAQMTPDSPSANDDFEVQTTPPHLMAPVTLQDDESTASEDDDQPATATVSQGSKDSRTTTPGRIRLVRGLGAGVRGPAPQSPKSSAEDSEHTKAPAVDLDDAETVSGTETGSVQDDAAASPPQSPAPIPPAASEGDGAPKRRGIGRIGGITSGAQPADTGVAASAESSDGAPRRRLGVIGNLGGSARPSPAVAPLAADAADASKGGAERGRAATPGARQMQAVEGARARETSEERADRRREELKRELQKKAAAGPAKKKRRF